MERRALLSTIVVDTTGDIATPGHTTLRDAIAQANGDGADDTITFSQTLSGKTITLISGELLITSPMSIVGPDAHLLAVDGNHTSRIFDVHTNGKVWISDITLQNGNGKGLYGSDNGGAIYNAGRTWLVRDTIAGNSANGDGGGVFTANTLVSIDNTFSSNAASDGGGICNAVTDTSHVSNGALLVSQNDTFAFNSAQSFGGAIINHFASAATYSRAKTTIINDTISGNAAFQGGGIYSINDSRTGSIGSSTVFNAINSIIAGNAASVNGDLFGTITSGGAHNLIGVPVGRTLSDILQTVPHSAPLLPLLRNNGGETNTIALSAASLALDAGTVLAYVTANGDNGLTLQQDNATFIQCPAFLQVGGEVVFCSNSGSPLDVVRAQLGTSQANLDGQPITLAFDQRNVRRYTNDLGAVTSSASPLLTLTSATTKDQKSVIIDYTVSNRDIDHTLTFTLYRSNHPYLDGSSVLIATQYINPAVAIAQLTRGTHEAALFSGDSIQVTRALPYVLVVANVDNAVALDAQSTVTASFQLIDLSVVPNDTTSGTQNFFWNPLPDGGFTFTYSSTNPASVDFPDTSVKFYWQSPDGSTSTLAYVFPINDQTTDTDGKSAKAQGLHRIFVKQSDLVFEGNQPDLHTTASPSDASMTTSQKGHFPTVVAPTQPDNLVAVIDPGPIATPFVMGGSVVEIDETNNQAVIKVAPLVVEIVSPGLNPSAPWDDFLKPFFILAADLQNVPEKNSVLRNRIAAYVSEWDSETSFYGGVIELILSHLAKAGSEQMPGPNTGPKAGFESASIAFGIAASLTASESDYLLATAALAEAHDIETNWLLPKDQSLKLQKIEFIGHSRGVSFNSIVAQKLASDGYTNIVGFVSLDGYSSDWKDDGGSLSRISIPKVLGTTLSNIPNASFNFQAAKGLAWDPFVLKTLPWIIPADLIARVQSDTDLRAPNLPGFRNIEIKGSTHTSLPQDFDEAVRTATPVASTYNGDFAPYFAQDYVFANRSAVAKNASLGPAAMISSPSVTVAPPTVDLAPTALGFNDGSIEKLGELKADLDAAASTSTGYSFLDDAIKQLGNMNVLMGLVWTISGDVTLSQATSNTALQLRASATGDAILSQSILLPQDANAIEFDLSKQGQVSTGTLKVMLNGTLLKAIDLAGNGSELHFSVPLPNSGMGSSANVSFDLSSSSSSATAIALDNFRIGPNHAPTGTSGTVTTNQNVPFTLKASDFGFADPSDSLPNSLLAVKFTLLPTVGTLKDNGVAIAANQVVSVGDINAGKLIFTPNANLSGGAFLLSKFQVQDDGGTVLGGSDLDPVAKALYINVIKVNHAPSGASGTVTTGQNVPYTLKAVDFGFADPNDSPGNSLLAVKFTLLPTLGSLKDGGVAVMLNQSVGIADINAGKVVFTPNANLLGGPYFLCKFQVQDNGGTLNGGTDLDSVAKVLYIKLVSVNHPPVGTTATLTSGENATYTFKAADFGFTDPNDTPANSLLAVKFTLLPTSATLTDSGAAIAVNQVVSVSDINAGKVAFTPNANLLGGPYFLCKFQVEDNGGTLNGGTDLDPVAKVLYVKLVRVNHPPVGTTATLTSGENALYTFKAADFGFTDPNDNPANSLLAVKFTLLPTLGSLTDSGTAIAVNQVVSVSDINAGKVAFAPNANLLGGPYFLCKFQVEDNGGTLNSGTDFDSVARVLYIKLTKPR